MSSQALVEPSFAEAIRLIEGANELSAQTRRHWMCSLRQIARALDRPPEVIPARFSAIRLHLAKLHHAPLRMTAKTLANHKSNTRAALLWLRNERSIPRHGAPLTPDWDCLRSRLSDRHTRSTLSPLMRFCSAQGIGPEDVDESVVDQYISYRHREMARCTSTTTQRSLVRLWNCSIGNIDGWPSRGLSEPPPSEARSPAWEDFPVDLRGQVESYLNGLALVRRPRSGQILRPCKQSTISLRRRQIVLAAKKAVSLGVPINSLSTLKVLLNPDLIEKVLNSYWDRNGETPKTFTIDMARTMLALARATPSIEESTCTRLEEIRAVLEQHWPSGLTDKNVTLIRQVLSEGVWSRVINLPAQLMVQARCKLGHAPIQAGVAAQLAVAIAILTVAPVRRSNLANIRIGTNLIRPGGSETRYWLVFPEYDVKNRVKLEFPLDDFISGLVDEYVHEFRPALLRGQRHDSLFPGRAGAAKRDAALGKQIPKLIQKATGLRITIHQFRHAAGALLLKKYPGNYELVRRVLGHRNMRTTVNYYCGLENVQASELFSELVREHLTIPEMAD